VTLRADKLLLGLAVALPWLFIWQGLDFTDQGYLFTIYRWFLRHPEAVGHTSHMWLTNVVGGVWDLLFGRLGVVGQRALWAVCTSFGLFLAFRAVRSCSSERAAALGVFVVSAFLVNRRETWFSYNTATSLLSTAAATTLFLALRANNLRGLALAGFILGVSPFARISNVLHATLLAAPVFAVLLERSRLPLLPRQLGAALLGYLVGVGSALLGMLALGHWSLFWQASYDLLHPSSPDLPHGVGALGTKLWQDHLLTVPVGVAIVAGGAGLVALAPRLPKLVNYGIYAALGVAGYWGLTRLGHTGATEPWTWLIIGPCYVLLAGIALGLLARSFDERLACFIGCVALFVTPLGSDNGIRAAYQGTQFAIPLAIAILYTAGMEARRALRPMAIVIAATMVGESVDRDLSYSYRDRPRPELWTSVAHQQLHGQLTTPARARVTVEVLSALEQRVDRGDYLLAYEGAPLLQYLTYTRPYTGHPWLMTDHDPNVVPGLLRTALESSKCLPVAVRSLGSTRSMDWPTRFRKLESLHAGTRKAIERFLRTHGYQATWRNDYFEILQPPGEPAHCR
jgi:hypothetical protein